MPRVHLVRLALVSLGAARGIAQLHIPPMMALNILAPLGSQMLQIPMRHPEFLRIGICGSRRVSRVRLVLQVRLASLALRALQAPLVPQARQDRLVLLGRRGRLA